MIIVPTLVIGFIIGLIILTVWSFKRKKIPSIETGIQLVVASISSISGLTYILSGIMNFLNGWFKFIPKINISLQEALGVIMFSGLVFLLVGLDQVKKYWKRKK